MITASEVSKKPGAVHEGQVVGRPILDGLHHEYERLAA